MLALIGSYRYFRTPAFVDGSLATSPIAECHTGTSEHFQSDTERNRCPFTQGSVTLNGTLSISNYISK